MTQTIGTTGAEDLIIETSGTQAIHIDAQQRVLVGPAAAAATGNAPQLRVQTGGPYAEPQVQVIQSTDNDFARVRMVSTRVLPPIDQGGQPTRFQTIWDLAAGEDSFRIWRQTGSQQGANYVFIGGNGWVGLGTEDPHALLDVNGTVKASVLDITGADLAERFAATEQVDPGTVLVIDPDEPGRLRPCAVPYDPGVAGVASGAVDLSAGVTLASDVDGIAVALAGRVWCQAEADSGPIRPGDRLTTSSIPGHAMRVSNKSRAIGAVIGKAMSHLDRGTGRVLTLVHLA